MEEKKILLYTFYNWNHLTYKLLRSLDLPVKIIYISNFANAKNLARHIELNHYDLIIGFGDYRKNAKKIRVEKKFINKYGKSEILENNSDFYFSTFEFPIDDNFALSEKTSWGPCNRSAYLILNSIQNNNIDTKFTFIHIPRSFDIIYCKNFITELIKSYGS